MKQFCVFRLFMNLSVLATFFTLQMAHAQERTGIGVPATPINIDMQPIYAIENQVGLGPSIYYIDYLTGGDIKTPRPIYSGLFLGNKLPHAFGIALRPISGPGNKLAIVSVKESGTGAAAGIGTSFFQVDLSTGISSPLGTALNYTYIKDIEFNPVSKELFGIFNNQLVKITLGASQSFVCPVTIMGTLDNVGVGPYSLAFNESGSCYILSARDHKTAIVTIPASTSQITPAALNTVAATVYQNPGFTIMNPGQSMVSIESGFCISGGTLLMGIRDPTISIQNFYQFGKPWSNKGTRCLLDYTANPIPASRK